jgi:hypothetical protein
MAESCTCLDYEDHLKTKQEEWEGLCIRCGACCGAYDDPCEHLEKDASGKYFCQIYHRRLGTRRTVAGEVFDCVPIQDIMHTHWKNDQLCIYKRYLKTPWILPHLKAEPSDNGSRR